MENKPKLYQHLFSFLGSNAAADKGSISGKLDIMSKFINI